MAQTRVDEAERATLLAQCNVVELKNTLALIAPRRAGGADRPHQSCPGPQSAGPGPYFHHDPL